MVTYLMSVKFCLRIFFNSHIGGWSPTGSTWHVGHLPAPGDYVDGEFWWKENWQGKPKYSDKTYPSATLSTTNPTWPDPGVSAFPPTTLQVPHSCQYFGNILAEKFVSWNQYMIKCTNFCRATCWKCTCAVHDHSNVISLEARELNGIYCSYTNFVTFLVLTSPHPTLQGAFHSWSSTD
jgi:hypothetical protein